MLITDIHSIASHATERKNPSQDPGTNKFHNPNPPEPNTQQQQPGAPPPLPPGKISKEAAERSGKSDAGVITMSVELLRTGILAWKHKKALTDRELDILEAAMLKDPDKLTPLENRIVQKQIKAIEKYEAKKKKIETKPEHFKHLADCFALHAEITGKERSPSAIMIAGITTYIGKILIDDFFD